MVFVRRSRISECLLKPAFLKRWWRNDIREESPTKSWGAWDVPGLRVDKEQLEIDRHAQEFHVTCWQLSLGRGHPPFDRHPGLLRLYQWWRRQVYLKNSSKFSYHCHDDVLISKKTGNFRRTHGLDQTREKKRQESQEHSFKLRHENRVSNPCFTS